MSDAPVIRLLADAIGAVIKLLRTPQTPNDILIPLSVSGQKRKQLRNKFSPTTVRDLLYMTSAGSKGYTALKDMLQNCVEYGDIVLVESHDLRDVHEGMDNAAAGEGPVYFRIHDCVDRRRINDDVRRLTVFTNSHDLWGGFLSGNLTIQELDFSNLSPRTSLPTAFLSGLSTLTSVTLPWCEGKLPDDFLRGCSGLTQLDLSPLQDVYDVSEGFLWGCSGLTELDLTPLSNLQEFPKNFFLAGCGFTTLDLSPLTKVRKLSELFLFNNKSLTTIILPPSITKVLPEKFVRECDALTMLDLCHIIELKSISKDLMTKLPHLRQITAKAATKKLFDTVKGIDDGNGEVKMNYV